MNHALSSILSPQTVARLRGAWSRLAPRPAPSGHAGPADGSGGVMPIGLDIGGDAVRMLQLRVSPGAAPEVVAAARGTLREIREVHALPGHASPDDSRRGGWEQAGDVVRDLLGRTGFKGRRVVANLPRSMVRIKTVRLPATSKADAAKQLAQDAQAAFGVDVTSPDVITHFLPGEPLRRGEGREGLLVVVKRGDVDRFVGRLHAWGAEVAEVDLEPLSLYRNVHKFGRRERDRNDATVVADVGSRATRVLVGRGGVLSFYKSLQVGGQTLHAAVGAALGLGLADAELLCRRESLGHDDHGGGTDAVARAMAGARRVVVEDLARELSLCLRYYAVTFRGRPPRRVVLTGGAATEPLRAALAAALEPILPLTVTSRQPLADLDRRTARAAGRSVALPPDVESGGDGEWATALGLALRQAPDGLPSERGMSRVEQQRREAEEAAAEAAAAAAASALAGDAPLKFPTLATDADSMGAEVKAA